MITILIPLYASAPWLAVIEKNVEEALSIGADVIISDRHGLDDALDRLRRRYAGNQNVRFLGKRDGADFVDNINGLIAEANGRYIRIVPHDDDASAQSTTMLLDALENDPLAVLAYGDVEYLDRHGTREPRRDTLHGQEPVAPGNWGLSFVLPIFWTTRYNGAFKALIRNDVIKKRGLAIKKIPKIWYSERAWLFGLGLAGRFHRVPGFMLRKRYYEESTHRQWRRTSEITLGGAEVLKQYSEQLIADPALKALALKDIDWNANRWMQHPKPTSADPGYAPLDGDGTDRLYKAPILTDPASI